MVKKTLAKGNKTSYTHDGEKRLLPPSAGAVKNQHIKGEKKIYNASLVKGEKMADHIEKEASEDITPPPPPRLRVR